MDKTALNAQLVTTGLKRVFYHLKSFDCGRSDMQKSFGCRWNEWASWYCFLLDLASDVMSTSSFCNILFYMQLLSSIAQNVRVWFEKHALELFQYSFVLFDNRLELNSHLKAIVEMIRPNISPELYAELLNCQETSCSVKRSFSMLCKPLAKMAISPQIV